MIGRIGLLRKKMETDAFSGVQEGIAMNTDCLKNMSLKARTALAVSGLFFVFAVCASYFTLSYFERKFKESISIQQFSHISSLADDIDDKFRIVQRALITAATQVPGDAWSGTESARRFLDGNGGARSLFDNGLFLVSAEGRLIAESPFNPGHRGMDFSRQEWFQKTGATGKPHISDPYLSSNSLGRPVVVLTVPVLDKVGNLRGMLAGSLDLLGENFLADISKVRIGKAGYLYIIDGNRIMIEHPDKARIMKPAAEPGVNRLYDRAVEGFEGSGETVASQGVLMLTSFKRLQTTSWILAANYPASEVYAPIFTAERYFAAVAVMGTAGLLLVTWLVVRRLMSPLAAVTRHVKQLPEKSGDERLITLDSGDEISVLAAAFNSMIGTLDRQREELRQEVAERRKTQEALAVKNEQLGEINSSLERLVEDSIAEIRKKDLILIQQSRQAAMGEMINNIAHQWRQPLNNLGLIVQSLQLDFETGNLNREEMKAASDKAMDTICFMSQTIDDFRNYFRPDKEKVRFNASRVVTSTLAIIEGSLNRFSIKMEINVTADPVIHGYPNEYAHVILNILNNARDALSEKEIGDPRITITIGTENEKSVVIIADNAGGIPEYVIDRIFDPFFTTKGSDNGTGAGLFMSKEIIDKNMGGRLAVRNTEVGAEFRIEV